TIGRRPSATLFPYTTLLRSEGDGILEVSDAEALEQAVTDMLSTPKEAAAMGQRAVNIVQRGLGSTYRHVSVILQVMAARRGEALDRKSTRLNSRHVKISYAV